MPNPDLKSTLRGYAPGRWRQDPAVATTEPSFRAALGARRGARLYRNAARALAATDWSLRGLLRLVATATLLADAGVVLANLVSREVFHNSFSWNIAASEVALVILGFVGGGLAYHEDRSIRVEVLIERLTGLARESASASTDWICGGVATVVLVWAWASYSTVNTAVIPGLAIKEGVLVITLICGMASVTIGAAFRLFRRALPAVLFGAIPGVVIVGLIAGLAQMVRVGEASGSSSLALGGIVALVMLLIGTPIEFSLLMVPAIAIVGGGVSGTYVAVQLQEGLTNFVLLAIPFFIFAGYVLTEGGLGVAIINMLSPLLKRAPGGLLQLTIGTMLIFCGMSGAKIADVAAVGSALREPYDAEGYNREEAAAVLSASASAGETVPPSITMLILGSITSLSIGTLFVAGILPALLVALAVALLVAVRHRRGLTQTAVRAATGRWSLRVLLRGIPAIGLPVVLIGGIESGVVTPTEASATAVAYALIVVACFRNGIGARKLLVIAEHSAAMSGMILLLTAVAHAMASSFALAQLPQRVASAIGSLGQSPIPLLLLTVFVLPVAGAILEGIPAILVFGPLLTPVAISLGINGIQYGIVFILAMGIGAFSPMMGIGFFTSCKIVDARIGGAARRYVSYFAALLAATCIVAFVSEVALFLPRQLGMAGA